MTQTKNDHLAIQLGKPESSLVATLFDEWDDYEQSSFTYQQGVTAFVEFSSGAFPFQGKVTPKNPCKKGTAQHIGWTQGFTDAQLYWFSNGNDPFASEGGSLFPIGIVLPAGWPCNLVSSSKS